MKIRQLLLAALLGAAALAAPAVHAHGTASARHGGIVQQAHDIGFELVVEAGGASLYLTDHDKDLPAQGISGRLTMLSGGQKTEVELKPAGGNRLRADGVKVVPGAKLVAVLNGVAGKTVTVRFAVK
jgi:hypothetical protein